MHVRLLAGVAGAAALVLLAPPSTGYAGTEHAATRTAPVWQACPPPADPTTQREPRQLCATLRVPMDYRQPNGRQITIEISRIATAKPTLRRGILLFNPGGPGASGLDLPSTEAALLPAEVLDRYDLIGFDPRGVGYSTPVSCGISPDTPPDVYGLPYPAPDGSIERNVAFARTAAAGCAAHAGDLLPFISTVNTARDMDLVRAALGEPKLSYLGYSYGTYLGTVYSTLFPQHSDRVILDSAVNPRLVWYDQWRLFSLGFALRFPDFTAWTAARNATYRLGSTPDAVERTYYAAAAWLDRDPLVLPNGLLFNGNDLRLDTFSLLYDDRGFPALAQLWQALTQAPAGVAGVDVLRTTRAAGIPTAQIPADNGKAAQFAVLCNDAAWPRSVATYSHNVAADRQLFPGTAGFPANIWPCAFWPDRPIEAPVRVTDRGPRNVLILQNLRDPATPWISGFGLRKTLGPRATMVSVDQGGHGVFPITQAPCATAIATDFLASGALPAQDRVCPGQSPGDVSPQRATPRLRLPGPL